MIDINITKSLLNKNQPIQLFAKLKIEDDEFLAITGPNGSGKTTLLRTIAGLEDANGYIKVDNKYWLDNKYFLKIQKRNISFVFQDHALFENLNVLQNLLFVNNDRKFAKRLLKLTKMTNYKNNYPNSLSSGEKQRISICRALMRKPKILLMDEPFSSLDETIKQELYSEILLLKKEFNMTIIMVSHDPREIYQLASRVIVLENGVITKDGLPYEILLNKDANQSFLIEGQIISMKELDIAWIAIVSIGQQLIEIFISNSEQKNLKVGQKVRINTKGFNTISL